MKVVIIDDEPHAIKTIESLLHLLYPAIAIVGTAQSIAQGINQIQLKKPDLIFLDIQLPDGTGFQILDELKTLQPVVIFTTAYQEFGHKAFRYDAVDYLLKPIDPEELQAAVERSQRRLDTTLKHEPSSAAITDDTPSVDLKITISQKNTSSTIRYDEIIRLQGDGSYTTLVLQSGEKIVASKGLKIIEEQIQSSHFLRIHQSHVINLKFIKASKLKGSKPSVIMDDDTEIAIAARRKDCLPVIEEWLS